MSTFRRSILLLSCLALLAASARGQTYTFTQFAGSADGMGFEDGSRTVARFEMPGGIAADGAGAYYVTDASATIRKIVRATGEVTTFAGSGGYGLVDGVGHLASFGQLAGLVRVGGSLYVAESLGIRKVDLATRSVQTVAAMSWAQGITVDSSGTLWAATNRGVMKVDPVTGVVTAVTTSSWVKDVAFDGNHTVYFTEYNDSAIYAIDTATLQVTIAAGSNYVFGNEDGPAATARFSYPEGLVCDPSGALFIADTWNGTIRKLDQGTVSTLAGAAGTWGAADGVGASARFFSPTKMTVDELGNLVVTDRDNSAFRLVDRATGSVTTVSGLPPRAGYVNDAGTAARFSSPDSVALDDAGNAYVGDTRNHVIRRIDPAGNVTTLAGLAGTPGSAGGTGSDARFSSPRGVAFDGAGNLFVADSGNATLRKIVLATGEVSTYAGQAGVKTGVDGTGTGATFVSPTALAVDGQAALWITDCLYAIPQVCRLRRVDLATAEVQRWASGFEQPGVIAGTDAVYVADGGRHSVYRVEKATKAVSLLAGSGSSSAPGAYGTQDGPPDVARFQQPAGMALDGAGHLLVLDEWAGTLRSVDLATGWVTTLAGRPNDWQNTDGTAGFARFTDPRGIARSADGTLYVVDDWSHNVRIGRSALPDRATIDASNGPVGGVRTLDVSPRTSTSWRWEIVTRPTGSTATLSAPDAMNPTFAPDVAGRYVFRLTATGTAATSITTVQFAAGDPIPAPTATISKDAGICVGYSADLRVSLTGTRPWRVVFSDGYTVESTTSPSVSRQVTPAATTTYTVTEVSDALQPGFGVGSATITVNPRPAPPVLTVPARVTAGATGITASVPDHAGSTYSWYVTWPATIRTGAGTSGITFDMPYAGMATLSVSETSAAGCWSGSTSVTINAVDYLPPLRFYSLPPCRVLDTRDVGGALTYQGETRTLSVAGVCGVPAEAKALVANITAANPTGDGYLSAYPTGMHVDSPATTAVSFRTGITRAGFGTWPLGRGDPTHPSLTIRHEASGSTHVLVDVSGYFK